LYLKRLIPTLFRERTIIRRQRVAAPSRLSLYRTSEEQLTEALVSIPYRADDLDQLEQSLHETITRMRAPAIRRPGAALPDRLQKLRHPPGEGCRERIIG
jgi:hypothetical protein